jgi:hypothetical protein
VSPEAVPEDLIAKLREMEELLSVAQLDLPDQSLSASRIRQVSILATYVRQGLERRKESANSDGNIERRGKLMGLDD